MVGIKQVAATLLATVLSLGAAEGVVRLAHLAPAFGAASAGQHSASTDPELIWVNTPGALDHNALGLRGPLPSEPRAGRRLLLLGDSVAYGFGLAFEDSIGARLGEWLGILKAPAEVLVAGTCGYNSLQEARWLELRADELHCDEIVLLYCLNDPAPSETVDERVLRDVRAEGNEGVWQRAQTCGGCRPPSAGGWSTATWLACASTSSARHRFRRRPISAAPASCSART